MSLQPAPLKYPRISDLKSGDLLFPKKPGDPVIAFVPTGEGPEDGPGLSSKAVFSPGHLAMTVGQLMALQPAQADPARLAIGLWRTRLQSLLETVESPANENWQAVLDDLELPQLLKLGESLLGEWVGTPGEGFPRLDWTVSHVAMAFEQDGRWYVIEAGCTDFSHYRVCIAPYLDAEDAGRSPGQARGWARRRTDLGQSVWSARHKDLKTQQVPLLLDHCKNFLSVPYGILEPGGMSNPDRIYCAELLQRGFGQVGLHMDEHQTWQWVMGQLGTAFEWPFKSLFPPTGRFPLLSPKMIYKDPRVIGQFQPTDASGKSLVYA